MDKQKSSTKTSMTIWFNKLICRKCGEVLMASRSEENTEETDCPFWYRGKCQMRKQDCGCSNKP
jgi:formylmethanofuran dehydrogenase subunit E